VPTLTNSYSGFVNGDTPASLSTQPTLTTTATAASHVAGNPYAITASGAADSDYAISYVAGALTVTPAALTITADNQTKVYGAAIPILTDSYSGFVNGDTAASLSTAPTNTTTATVASHVAGNPYAINVSGAVDSDYTISYVAGALTVTPAALTITADNQSKVYGAAVPALTDSYSGFVNGDTAASLSNQATTTTAATASSHVAGNPYAITVSGAADSDYAISYVAGNLTVTPAALTITADNQTKIYGAAIPTLTDSFSGFVNGDTAASLSTQPTNTTTATATSKVSGNPYAITASGAADSDYAISYVAGSLTVTPAALTITASANSKAYDGGVSAAATPSVSGLVGTDTVSDATEVYADKNAGSGKTLSVAGYTINDGDGGADYTVVTVASASGVITPAALTLTAAANSKTYDGGVSAAAVPTVAGLVAGDTVTGLTEAYANKTVGSGKTLNVTGFTVNDGDGGGDYTVSTIASTAGVITPATLTAGLTGTVSKTYDATTGAALSAANYSLTGVVAGDSVALNDPETGAYDSKNVGVGKTVSVTGLGLTGADAGDYVLAASSTSSAIGVITPAPLTLTAAANSKTYDGGVGAAAMPTVSGLMGSDTVSGLVETYASKTVGSGKTLSVTGYTVNDGYGGGDYTVSTVANTAGVITPATLTAALSGTVSKTYDASTVANLAAANYSLTGMVAGDAVALNDPTTGTYDTKNVGLGKTVSVSGLSLTGADAGDYVLASNATSAAIGVITPAALTVTAAANSKIYDGGVSAAATPTVSGLVGSDTVSGLTETYASKTAGSGKTLSVTGYTVNDGYGGGDYTVSTVANTAGVITPATLTAGLIGTVSKTYDATTGASLAVTNYSLTGAVAGDAVALNDPATGAYDSKDVGVGKTVSVTGLGLTGADAGDYVLAANTTSASIGVITPAALTLTAAANSKTYDGGMSAAATPVATGLMGSDTVTATEAYSDKNAGSGKTLSITGYTVADGAGGADYIVSTLSSAAGVITPAALTISANNIAKLVSAPDPALTYTVTSGALLAGDTATGALDRQTGAAPGVYAILQGTLTVGANYQLTYAPGVFTIYTPATFSPPAFPANGSSLSQASTLSLTAQITGSTGDATSADGGAEAASTNFALASADQNATASGTRSTSAQTADDGTSLSLAGSAAPPAGCSAGASGAKGCSGANLNAGRRTRLIVPYPTNQDVAAHIRFGQGE
ncbi:MAG: beta strand repeat-containing protein, partial [Caulobacteraceae bacterium]